MKTQLQSYFNLQKKFNRIEQLTNAAWEVHYYYIKLKGDDDFDFDDIIDYMTIQLQLYAAKMKKGEGLNLPTLKK